MKVSRNSEAARPADSAAGLYHGKEGSTQNLWLLKGPVVEDRTDGWMKTRVLAS